MQKKILLIRLDKIGDLICTLCVDQASLLQGYQSSWVVAKGLGFIPDNAQPERSYIELSKDDWKNSLKTLRLHLKTFKPDLAVSFQAPWWVSYALWVERVPVRTGVISQWHSFLFFNRGLRQKRSQAVKHESDYNMDLLKHALGKSESSEPTPVLSLKAPRNPGLFEKYDLVAKKYVVVHPGMAGSALNWPVDHYIRLIKNISAREQIVITGTPADEPWLKKIKKSFQHERQVLILQNKLSAKDLLVILKNARAVVVPSTGVAHIAASLGTPVLGIYSPLRVHHPTRWGPRGNHVKVFLPVVENIDQVDPQCMSSINPEEVIKALETL